MTFAEPPFKSVGRDAEAMDVTMIELAGADAAAPTEEGRLSGGASNEAQRPPGAALTFDETMTGLTLDEVSVVLVGDRPLLVPLSAGLAQRSGFIVIEVSDDSLLSLGVLPRREHVEVVDLVEPVESVESVEPVESDAPRPPSGPTAVPTPTAGVAVDGASPTAVPTPTAGVPVDGASPIAPNLGPVTTATGTWATWPTADAGADLAAAPGWPAPVPPIPDSSTGPSTAPTIKPSTAPTIEPGALASVERPAPVASSLSEAPVETARPINAMAASHLDWEPGALGWPYVERRLEAPSTGPDLPTTPPPPRLLTSGRPVNHHEAIEIVLRGDAIDDTDLIIELGDVATVSLAPITLAVAATSLTVVSGPRGSGKTSLLRLLAGFDTPTQGTGLVGGERLESIHPDDRASREAISAGFVPQAPFLVPDLTVAENVELPLLASDVSPAMARGTAEETLRLVGLGSVIGLPAAVLSGAEVRLAAVARALVSSPEIVFADEPFAGLSDEDAATVLALLHDVVADGGTVIIACTDSRARLHGVRQLLLDRGRLISDDVASATH